MTDSDAKTKSTPPLKAAWFEDDEQVENELKAAAPTSKPSPSKSQESSDGA